LSLRWRDDLLDEVGDMSPKVQAKVLRVLEEQRFEPVAVEPQSPLTFD
jgi:transcriptional regulator with GAF, ATPase, and Fis domain